jgi:uncharacterized protein YecE (DUF72 family)
MSKNIDVYCYFKNDIEDDAVRNAQKLKEMLKI